MQGLNILSNPTPETSYVQLALVEGGAVIPGRSYAAWKRDPLEFRERIFDEVAVAAFWLWGVGWMQKIFDAGKRVLPPALRAVDTQVQLMAPKDHPPLELTPLERYAAHHREALAMMGMRSARIMFGVVTSGLMCAWVIPRLNQHITEWILDWEARKAQKALSQPQTPAMPPAAGPTMSPAPYHGLAPDANPAWRTSPAFQAFQSASHPAPGAMRFGSSGLLSQGLNGLARAAEWVDTSDYGRILSNDVALVSGRSLTALTREDVARKDTRFEALEVLVRDIGSNYFYLFALPNFMALAGAGLRRLMGASLGLEPLVAQSMSQALWTHPQMQHAVNQGRPLDRTALEALYHGQQGPAQEAIAQTLRAGMTSADAPAFWSLLETEGTAAFGKDWARDGWANVLRQQLGPQPRISGEQVAKLLQAVQRRQGAFSDLKDPMRLVVALKQAYRHTVGVPVAELLGNPDLQHALSQMPPEAQAAFKDRLSRAAAHDSLNQVASHWQRLVNRVRETMGPDHPWLIEADGTAQKPGLARLLDSVVAEGLPWKDTRRLKDHLASLPIALQNDPVIRAHIGGIQRGLEPANHRIWSLAPTPETLEPVLKELAGGGLRHDRFWLRQALKTLGALPTDHRLGLNSQKQRNLEKAMDDFWSALMKRAEPLLAKSPRGLTPEVFATVLEKGFIRQNLLPRSGAFVLGTALQMVGLAFFIPWLQYKVTRKLTGEYEHPSLIALKRMRGLVPVETPNLPPPDALKPVPSFAAFQPGA